MVKLKPETLFAERRMAIYLFSNSQSEKEVTGKQKKAVNQTLID
jgi:hypothetical protein